MRIFRDKKGEEKSIGLVVSLVLAGVFLAFVIALLLAWQTGFLNLESFGQNGCWMTNTLRCSGGFFSYFGSLCFADTVEDVDAETLAGITRDTWWMYKQGTCDYGAVGDEVFSAYTFTPKEDMTLKDFLTYLTTHNRGRDSSIEHSDYAYLEENTEGATVCFDSATITDHTLKKGTVYYLRFSDDQVPHQQGDMLLISEDPEFVYVEPIAEESPQFEGEVVVGQTSSEPCIKYTAVGFEGT